MNVGDIARASYEGDQYDGCLVRVVSLVDDDEDEVEVEILNGPLKGNTKQWDLGSVIPLSALEQLAMEAEDA